MGDKNDYRFEQLSIVKRDEEFTFKKTHKKVNVEIFN